jgi:hypothetical protein
MPPPLKLALALQLQKLANRRSKTSLKPCLIAQEQIASPVGTVAAVNTKLRVSKN